MDRFRYLDGRSGLLVLRSDLRHMMGVFWDEYLSTIGIF